VGWCSNFTKHNYLSIYKKGLQKGGRENEEKLDEKSMGRRTQVVIVDSDSLGRLASCI
jgi:hypothetical protein